jgi:competence protein ComEC
MVFLCAGIAVGIEPASGRFLIILLTAAALTAAAIGFLNRWPPAAAFFVCFVLGLLRVNQSLATDPAVEEWVSAADSLRAAGYVLETAQTKTERTRIVMDAYFVEKDGERRDVRTRILAVLPEGQTAGIGDGIVLRGEFLTLDEARNPGAFNEFLYYKARKIHYKCFPEIEKITAGGAPLKLALSEWRKRLADVYASALPSEEAALVTSVILGDKSGLEETTEELYRAAGVYHLLCVSGLHVSIISLLIYKLLGLFLDKRRAGVINLAILILYCVFTGSSISTVRAVFMAGVVIMGGLLFRERDLASSVGFAAVCLLLYEPLYIFDAGFQLSFSAVFGIAALTSPIERALSRLERIPRPLRAAASANLAAILGTLPCLLYHFYILTPYAFFANLIILPTSSILVGMGALTGAVGVFWPDASEFLAGTLYLLLRFYRSVCEFFRQMPAAEILTGSCGLSLALLLAAAALLFAFWFSGKPNQMKTRRRLFVMSLAACAIAGVYRYRGPGFEITMLDVGQGDAFVIRQDHLVFILDGGGLPNVQAGDNTGNRVLVPYLDYLGITHIDGVFVSHPDNDHAAGILELLPRKQIDRLYFANAVDRGNALYNDLTGACEANQIPVSYLSEGDMISMDETRISTLYPPYDAAGSGNETSLVLQFFYDRAAILFTGDIDSAIEKSLTFAAPTVLKLSHHGSKYSNDEEFLRRAAPAFAIVSAGRRNTYGLPAPETLECLRRLGIPLYNTAERGAVILTYQNGGFTVETMINEESDNERT